jgi:hypothetical protein
VVQNKIKQVSPILNNNFRSLTYNFEDTLTLKIDYSVYVEVENYSPQHVVHQSRFHDSSNVFHQSRFHYKYSSLGDYLTSDVKQDEFFKENKIEFNKDEYDLYLSSDWVLDGEWLQIKGQDSIGTLDNLFIGEFIGGYQQKIGEERNNKNKQKDGKQIGPQNIKNIRFKWVPMGSKPPEPIVIRVDDSNQQ